MEMSPKIQNQLMQYQQLQQQLQSLINQRVQAETKLNEINKTLEELDKLKEDPTIYKSIGNLLIRTEDVKGIRDELEEQKEVLDVRVSSFRRQENELNNRYKELEKSIRAEMDLAE